MGEQNTKNRTESVFSKFRRYCPVPSMIFFGIAVAAIIVHIICIYSTEFSDIMNNSVCRSVRLFLPKLQDGFLFRLQKPYCCVCLLFLSL